MSTVSGLEESTVKQATTRFYSALRSPILPDFEFSNNHLCSKAKEATKDALVLLYTEIYMAASSPNSGYGSTAWLEHSPQQITLLLV